MTDSTSAVGRRGSILVEQAKILSHEEYPGQQFVMTVKAPEIVKRARAGQFVHIRCGFELPMRRPLSIMRVEEHSGSMDLLYKVVGTGTRILASRHKNEHLDIMGPIGEPFRLDAKRPRPLLLGGGVGIPPMIFLADTIRRSDSDYRPMAIFGSELPYPFALVQSKFVLAALSQTPNHASGLKILEDWGVPSRLCSLKSRKGSYKGYVTDLARIWLASQNETQLQETSMYACGPEPMLKAVAKLAAEFNLPCQISLEEYMACAVGGCAGCVVKVKTDKGPAMKRVCVDGPVFDAYSVYG